MKKYAVGDYVMHESAGICQVETIETMALQGRGSEKDYYKLKPVYQKDGQIITPVNDDHHRIRDVKSPGEMADIMNHVADIDVIREKNERTRQEKIREKIQEFNPEALAGVVKTAYLRKQKRIRSGKKAMSADERVLQLAGRRLFEEMAFSLKEDLSTVEKAFYTGLDSLLDA